MTGLQLNGPLSTSEEKTMSKNVTITLEPNSSGKLKVYWNEQELETVEDIIIEPSNISDVEPFIFIKLKVPSVNLQTKIQHVHLSTNSYKLCEDCGKWLIPSIEKDLKEKVVVATYSCQCGWKGSAKIQDWNEGIKEEWATPGIAGEELDRLQNDE